MEGDFSLRTRLYKLPYFNPLPPHGGRRGANSHGGGGIPKFQSTPSTRRETTKNTTNQNTIDISIHSLHTEGDKGYTTYILQKNYFNPLPPHGGRHIQWLFRHGFRYFNPLPPHGGRLVGSITQTEISHFNPLPPHGGRLQNCFQLFTFSLISIHSLHTEGDTGQAVTLKIRTEFQSTPSTRRETVSQKGGKHSTTFQSTPSTRRETSRTAFVDVFTLEFQSTPSTRRETRCFQNILLMFIFQSTPSTRRETRQRFHLAFVFAFQSTPSTRRETDIFQ